MTNLVTFYYAPLLCPLPFPAPPNINPYVAPGRAGKRSNVRRGRREGVPEAENPILILGLRGRCRTWGLTESGQNLVRVLACNRKAAFPNAQRCGERRAWKLYVHEPRDRMHAMQRRVG